MKNIHLPVLMLVLVFGGKVNAQVTSDSIGDSSTEKLNSTLPQDGVIPYLPLDSTYFRTETGISIGKVHFKPTVNFYFRPEGTVNYKGATMPEDTGHLNFYLRADFGGRLSLPKNIDMVLNIQSNGIYTRSFGPLDRTVSLFEAYVDMKKLDKDGKLSLRVGRMSIGRTGNELLIGDNGFGTGRSFESVRFQYHTPHSNHEVLWAQLYQEAPDSVNFDWNHPIFLATLNTFHFSPAVNLDANMPYIIDQYNSGYRTSVFMPGVRLFGAINNFQYNAEFIYQTGTGHGIVTDAATCKVNASVMELAAGYLLSDKKLLIDFTYYRGSGDDQPNDNELKSYNYLWQNEHRRFGHIDAFKGSNVQAGTIHLDWKIGRLVATGIYGVYAEVLEPLDNSTGVATVPLSSITTTSKSLGYGGDWYVNYFYNHYLNVQLSTSVFSPGEYFTAASGIDKTMFRFFLIMTLKI